MTDGETRAALACVRALTARGHEVHVAASSERCLAGVSRYAAGSHAVGDPAEEPARFAERLVEVAERIDADLVLPATEATLGSIYAFGVAERIPVVCPDRAAYETAVDKHELLRLAGNLGIDVPRTVLCDSPAELRLSASLRYPVVVKARRSRFLAEGRWIAGEVRIVRDDDELRRARTAPGFAGGVLVQEFVPGSGEGVFLLSDGGRTLARFAHRRLREKPPWGGVSVLSESIVPAPELLAGSERLLEALTWRGLAMLEFRRTPDGRAYLMELNPRLWGSVQLAIDAGVDFPSLLVALQRRAPAPKTEASIGVRTRWLLGDLDHLLICLRRREVRKLRGRSVLGLLWDFARSFFDGSRLEVLRPRDWRPFVHELGQWLRG